MVFLCWLCAWYDSRLPRLCQSRGCVTWAGAESVGMKLEMEFWELTSQSQYRNCVSLAKPGNIEI